MTATLAEYRPMAKTKAASNAAWYLTRSATRMEARALASLAEAGFDAYCPMIVRWDRVGRRDQRVMREYPLFPGYLFVWLGDGQHADVESADGVSGFVRYTDASGARWPRAVPLTMLDELRRIVASGEHDEPDPNTPPAMEIGERVLVTDGPYKGYFGQIRALPGPKRVQLMLEAVTRGGWVWQVEVDRPHVEKAA
jgi:transcriptional antiterminator RfaH